MSAQHPRLTAEDISVMLEARRFWTDDPQTRHRVAAIIAAWNPDRSTIPILLGELERSRSRISKATEIDNLVQRITRRNVREAARITIAGSGPQHIGTDVSSGLEFRQADPQRISAAELPRLDSAKDLAAALEVSERHLTWLTYHRGTSTVDHYARFTIPKRSGAVRVIAAPKPYLKHAQRWVLREILEKISVHEAATAFRPGGSVLVHASRHSGRKIVVRADLKDFFATITFKRVKGLFTALGYSEGIATLLALLCTDPPRVAVRLGDQVRHVAVGGFQLPQGACTSPTITNILSARMDARLTGLANQGGFVYSRYADDMVFSTDVEGAAIGRLLGGIHMVAEDEGFAVNDDKTRIMRAPNRQIVTGLIVNARPSIPRADLRKFRAFLHRCERDGLSTVSGEIGKSAHDHASGYLSWIRMIDPDRASQIADRHPWILQPGSTTDQ